MKTILITGVGKGIGNELARRCLDEHMIVLGTYAHSKPAFTDESFYGFRLDLTSSESIRNCCASLQQTGRKIDIFINNAGVLLDAEETSVVIEKLRQTLEVNVIGTIDFTEHVLPLMASGGHIVNISSRVGSIELADQVNQPLHYPSYKISKAALNMYTRALANRLKPQGITVSAIHPGWVKTEMGGLDADIAPSIAAQNVFEFATSQPETGGFWYEGRRLPW